MDEVHPHDIHTSWIATALPFVPVTIAVSADGETRVPGDVRASLAL